MTYGRVYLAGTKQKTALFNVVLLVGLAHAAFDSPHLHVESTPVEPTTAVVTLATGTSAAMMMSGYLRLP